MMISTASKAQQGILSQLIPEFILRYLRQRNLRQKQNIFDGVVYRDRGNGVPEIDGSELNIPSHYEPDEADLDDAIPPNESDI